MAGFFNKIKTYLIWIMLLFATTAKSQPAVDGFLKGKSNLDMAFGGTYESFSQYYQRLNETTPVGRTSIAASLFGAMGITNWLDAQINVPYIYTSADFSNFQDFSGYLKGAVINKYFESGSNFRLMLVGGTSFPMSDYQTENVNAIGQQVHAIDGRMVVQYMNSKGMFFMVQGGYIQRDNPTPSASAFAFKLGWAKANSYFDVWYDQQIADGGNDYGDYREILKETKVVPFSFKTLGVAYGKLGLTYYKPIGELSGLAAGASYVLWGRNVGQAFGVSVSYIRHFSFSGND